MRRQAAYLRVSTPQQSEALQREAIQRAASARGESVELWFSEKVGGKASHRPELDSVRKLARRGDIGALWIFRLDRLARGAVFLLNVVEELRKNGCKIVSVSENIDFEGPWSVPIMATLGTAAEIELEGLRDRMAGARAKAERAGKRWGRPPAAGAPERETLAELISNQGLTLRQAAKVAGLSYGTAQRIMSPFGQAKKGAND